MKSHATISLLLIILCAAVLCTTSSLFGQVVDGVNKYQFIKTLSRGVKGTDSTGTDVGRDVMIVPGPNSLDGDNLADLVVTDYQGSGRVHVFEQSATNSLVFNLVWTSKTPSLSLAKNKNGPQSTPRTVAVGDLDGNGKKEIIFPVGYAVSDSVTSDTTLARGLQVYEWNGVADNNYGTDPLRVIRPQVLDTAFNRFSWGRAEGQGLLIDDVDGDGKNELVSCSREFNFETGATAYILQVTSGTFAAGTAVLAVEYKYADFKYVNDDGVLPDSSDGYIPFGVIAADVDGDGKKELVFAGWCNNKRGGSLGFVDIPSANTYTEGSIVGLTDYPIAAAPAENPFQVSFRPAVRTISGQDYVYFLSEGGITNALYVAQNISNVNLVSNTNIKRISKKGLGSWGGLLAADQDHGNGTDGFEVYFPNGGRIAALEYKGGTADPADSTSYVLYDSLFTLGQVFKSFGGAITDVMGFQGMDLNGNKKREVLVNYKPGATDTLLSGQALKKGTYSFFFVEWGDSATIVTSVGNTDFIPDHFSVDQNYPNPFNPSTTIRFHVPFTSDVTLRIYDVLGREVQTLLDNKSLNAGNHEVVWDGKNRAGLPVASGNYFYRFDGKDFSVTRQMVLLK